MRLPQSASAVSLIGAAFLLACGTKSGTGAGGATSAGNVTGTGSGTTTATGVATTGTGATGSSTGTGAGGNSVVCNLASLDACTYYENLPPQTVQTQQMTCAAQGGTVVASCPTTNLIGCCKIMFGGDYEYSCYYVGVVGGSTAASDCLKAPLNGMWSTMLPPTP